ncbi:hypothetical protein [Dyella japonica]|uniref:hypothetical protein n=1 Tax=Dyella japonica TaxID=231455 RepID=UPI000314C10B|nr:hypothetical protein [Dyella japonica]
MDPTTLDAPIASAEHPQVRRVSQEPTEGYVLDPWSGLYKETDATYHRRLQALPGLSA